jgi:hypothetical protein
MTAEPATAAEHGPAAARVHEMTEVLRDGAGQAEPQGEVAPDADAVDRHALPLE